MANQSNSTTSQNPFDASVEEQFGDKRGGAAVSTEPLLPLPLQATQVGPNPTWADVVSGVSPGFTLLPPPQYVGGHLPSAQSSSSSLPGIPANFAGFYPPPGGLPPQGRIQPVEVSTSTPSPTKRSKNAVKKEKRTVESSGAQAPATPEASIGTSTVAQYLNNMTKAQARRLKAMGITLNVRENPNQSGSSSAAQTPTPATPKPEAAPAKPKAVPKSAAKAAAPKAPPQPVLVPNIPDPVAPLAAAVQGMGEAIQELINLQRNQLNRVDANGAVPPPPPPPLPVDPGVPLNVRQVVPHIPVLPGVPNNLRRPNGVPPPPPPPPPMPPAGGNIPPPPIPPGINPVVPPRPVRANTYVRINANNYEVTIGDSPKIRKEVANARLECTFAGLVTNPHAVSAAVRTSANVFTLGKCGGRRVVDYYSGYRTPGMVRTLNNRAHDPIHLSCYRPIVVAADINRPIIDPDVILEDDLWIGTDQYDDVLVCDIYDDIRDANGAFSKEIVSGLISRPGQRLFWIGYCFTEPMGQNYGESAWIVDQEKVTFSPDDVNPCYGPHNSCNWIWKSEVPITTPAGHCISWSIMRSWRNYHVVKFENLGTHWVQQKPSVFPVTWMEKNVEIRDQNVLDEYLPVSWVDKIRLLSGQPGKQTVHVICKYSTWNELDAFKRGAKEKMQYSQLEKRTVDLLQDDEDYKTIAKRFPALMMGYPKNLAMAIFLGDLESAKGRMAMVTSASGALEDFNKKFSSIGKVAAPGPGIPKLTLLAGGLVAGAATVVAAKKLWDVVIAVKDRLSKGYMPVWDQGVLMRIVAPITEEYFKDLMESVGIPPQFFGMAEFIAYVYTWRQLIPLPVLIMLRGSALWMHLAIQKKDLKRRMALHSLWNTGTGVPSILFAVAIWKDWDFDTIMRAISFATMWEALVTPKVLVAMGFVKYEVAETAACALGLIPNWMLGTVISYFLMKVIVWFHSSKTKAIGTSYEEFRENMYIVPWEERKPWVITCGVTSFPQNLSETPTQEYSFYDDKPQNPDYHVKLQYYEPGWRPVHSAYYWLIPTQIPGYVPMKSDANMVAIVEARLAAAPPLPNHTQFGHWEELFHFADSMFLQDSPIIREEVIPQWIEHMVPSKQKKYRSYLEKVTNETELIITQGLATSKIQIKHDELLIKGNNDWISMKPRGIINVNPAVQALIGPEIYEAMCRLKKLWNVREPFVYKSFSFAYGGCATDEELSEWMEWTLHNPHLWHIIVAGDDLLVLNHSKRIYLEGDAKMFDQSQGDGPIYYEHLVFKKLGVSPETITMSMKVCASNFVGYSGDERELVRVDRDGIMGRLSGHSDTSIGNSLVMLTVTYQVISSNRMGNLNEWEIGYLHYGIDMKLKLENSPCAVTFLKGLWYQCTTGLYWGPLPSRVLKCGKALKDPRMLYRSKDFDQASKWFLGDVAKGYSYFIRVPVLRAFINNFTKFATGKRLIDLDERMLYKFCADTTRVKPLIISLDNICERYNTTYDEISELEEMFPKTPFNFIQHPLLEKLAADYA